MWYLMLEGGYRLGPRDLEILYSASMTSFGYIHNFRAQQ